MAHRFTFTVEVEVNRTEGKFASREEIADQLREALETADPGQVYGIGADGASSYDVDAWEVQDA